MPTYTDKQLGDGSRTINTNTTTNLYTVPANTTASVFSFRVNMQVAVASGGGTPAMFSSITFKLGNMVLLIIKPAANSAFNVPQLNTNGSVDDQTSSNIQGHLDLMGAYDGATNGTTAMKFHNAALLTATQTISVVTVGGAGTTMPSITLNYNISGLEIS